LEIRALREEEKDLAYAVWSQAFERGDRAMADWRDWEATISGEATTYGVWDAAGLQATFFIVDYRIHFGPDLVLPMAGVNGVACLPAARGRGYASAGMKYCFERMRAKGQHLSILEPFSFDFYRKLGYEWIGPRLRYAVPTRILKSDPETEQVHAATPADRAAILACYAEFAGRYRGAIVRGEAEWNDILHDKPKLHTYTYLYEREGKCEGYLTYRGGKKEETWLREFIALTPRAQRALLGLLRRHEMQVDKFIWTAPPDDTLWSQLMHGDIETKLQTVLMARIVDVQSALQALPYRRSGVGPPRQPGVIAIQDEAAPWNAGTWGIQFEDERVVVERTDAPPQLTLDIQALTQAYLGSATLWQLYDDDNLVVHDEDGMQCALDLLTGPQTWINDGF